MARDLELLSAAEQGVPGCRVYTWDGLWVSLGRFQSAERALVDAASIRWVSRPTGGKAVIHGHDVTVALAFPIEPRAARGLKAAYRLVAAPLIQALRHSGVEVGLAEDLIEPVRNAPTADCFAHSSACDIVHPTTHRKVCGCALKLTESAVLAQASIPNGRPLSDPRLVIRDATSEPSENWDASSFADNLGHALSRM